MKPIIKPVYVFILLICIAMSASAADIQDFSKGWEYRLGDDPSWALESGDPALWSQIDFPSNPEDRVDETNAWFRAELPENRWRAPALYIYSIDLIAQVYLDGKMIYQFGDMNPEGAGTFRGWPWHVISLPDDMGGKYLYVRVYSNYPDIGLWGQIEIGSKHDLMKHIFRLGNLLRLIIGSIALYMGLIFLISFTMWRKNIPNFFLGLLISTQGLDMMLSSQITQIYFFYPLTSQYLMAFCYFFLPVGVAAYIESIIGSGHFKLVRRVWQIFLIYLIASMLLPLSGAMNLSSFYMPFDKLYYFFGLPVLLIYTFNAARRNNIEARLLFAGYFIMVLSYMQSTLTAIGWLPWSESYTHLGIFIFLAMLCLITLKRYTHSKLLEDKNRELAETQLKLERKNSELDVLSRTDALTKLHNRMYLDLLLENAIEKSKSSDSWFSVVMVDFDRFKIINDTYGHQTGDIILKTISGVLKASIREADHIGRWGGEEFLIILPDTDYHHAQIVAEKLRDAVASYCFEKIPSQTASFGVATYAKGDKANTLLARADKALYMAKSNGRNNVKAVPA
ncbi:MAG: diguanylate cyclase [Deferribacterales bacterium]